MKIQTLIRESSEPYNDDERHQLSLIADACSDHIQSMAVLYRGAKPNPSPISSILIRKNRVSLSKKHLATILFDELFARAYSVDNIRVSSAFATNDYATASSYGVAHYTFVKNGSTLAFREGRRDSIQALQLLEYQVEGAIERALGTDRASEVFSALNDANNYQDPNFWVKEINKAAGKEGVGETIRDGIMSDSYIIDRVVGEYSVIKPSQMRVQNVFGTSPAEIMITDSNNVFLVDTRNAMRRFVVSNPDDAYQHLIKYMMSL